MSPKTLPNYGGNFGWAMNRFVIMFDADGHPLNELFALHHQRWLVFCKLVVFVFWVFGARLEFQTDHETVYEYKGVSFVSESVDAFRFTFQGPKHGSYRWMKRTNDMTPNRNQWREYDKACLLFVMLFPYDKVVGHQKFGYCTSRSRDHVKLRLCVGNNTVESIRVWLGR